RSRIVSRSCCSRNRHRANSFSAFSRPSVIRSPRGSGTREAGPHGVEGPPLEPREESAELRDLPAGRLELPREVPLPGLDLAEPLLHPLPALPPLLLLLQGQEDVSRIHGR